VRVLKLIFPNPLFSLVLSCWSRIFGRASLKGNYITKSYNIKAGCPMIKLPFSVCSRGEDPPYRLLLHKHIRLETDMRSCNDERKVAKEESRY